MPDKQFQHGGGQKPPDQDKTGSPKPLREVVVQHHDEPTSTGKRTIHPRRPAPIIPDRKPKAGDDAAPGTSDREESSNE